MASTARCVFDTHKPSLVVGRTPLIPVDVIAHILEAEDPLEALRSLLARNQLVRQAIYVASPALNDALEPWLSGVALKSRRAPLRAMAYFLRMAFRCTPFGLFAGIGLVDLGHSTTLRAVTEARRTRTRPDMGVLMATAKSLETNENRGNVRYVANRAVVERGDRLYVTNVELTDFVTTGHGTVAEQRPVSLKHTDAVRHVRAITEEGQPYSKIVSELASRFEAAPEAAAKILDRLIEAGVVISELRPSPVGDPVAYMLERFEAIDVSVANRLRAGLDLAVKLDRKPLQAQSISELQTLAFAFSPAPNLRHERTTQIDLHAPFSGTLKDTLVHDAAELAEYSIRMAPVVSMAAFRKRFEEHYEGADRLVPLLELVDPNLGLGFPDEVETQRVENAARDCALASIACNAIRTRAEEVELTSKEVEIIIPQLPGTAVVDSVEIGFHVVAASREAVEKGEYCIAPAPFTGSDRALRSLGRFADLLGHRALERMRSFADSDVQNGAILAELAFAPAEPRYYNVVIRPRILKDELQFGIGEPRGAAQISLDDLSVGLDSGLFYLWSSSRQRRVAPRESHLFVTGRFAPNVCRFLANLQYEGRRIMRGFDWGHLSRLTYLPRVRVGRIVLSPRRWTFTRPEPPKSPSEMETWVDEVRSRWGLPRYVLSGDDDNRLLIDLESAIAPELLLTLGLSDGRALTLVEALPSPEHTWIEGTDGRYVVEFVASLLPSEKNAPNGKTDRPKSSLAGDASSPAARSVRKRYGLGSPWVFVKLYMGTQAIDGFLANAVVPLVRALQDSSVIDRWFFVRYADPFSHLRLRLRAFQKDDTTLRDRLITAASQWMERGEILRYAFDTYDPEFERYGGETGIDRAERFFTLDSEVCSELLRGLPRSNDELVAAAVESFLPWLGGGDLTETALNALQLGGSRPLTPSDRVELKRLQSASIPLRSSSDLVNIASGQEGQSRVAALFHMHCNRLGLTRSAELRATALARHVLLGRRATRSQKQFSHA